MTLVNWGLNPNDTKVPLASKCIAALSPPRVLHTFAHRKLAASPREPLLAFYLDSKDSGAKRKRRKEVILSVPKENNPVKILKEIMIHALVLGAEERAGVYKHQEDPRKAGQRIYDPSPPTERWEAEVTSSGTCRLAIWHMQQPIGNPILNKVEAESQHPRLSSDCYMCAMALICACMQNVCVCTHSKAGKSIHFL